MIQSRTASQRLALSQLRAARIIAGMTEPAKRKRFPILRRIWRNWRSRHQDPRNFAIHMLGIPVAVAGVFLLFFLDWYYGGAAIIVGYILQWIGHRWEGNDVGEWAAIKRLLGLPTVAISPRFAKAAQTPPAQPE